MTMLTTPALPRDLELYRLYNGRKRVDIEESKNLADSMPEKTSAMNQKLTDRLVAMKASYPYYNPAFAHDLPNKEKVPAVLYHKQQGRTVEFSYEENGANVVRAQLMYTLNGGSQDEEWFRMPAILQPGLKVTAELPEGTTHYVINLIDENNFLISYPEMIDERASRTEKYSERALSAEGVAPSPAPEKKAPVPAMFIRLDQNKDGKVTLEEYIGLFMPNAERQDRNRDGLLTPEEFPYAGSFRLGDADQSGTLTMDEAKIMYEKQFNGRDTNNDGVVTADEM